jgi:6-phosphogluconolactonase (cycloisomerase 2 family)
MNSNSLRRFTGVLLLALASAVMLAGCDSTYNHVVSIAVTPASPSIAVGKTQQFTATATFSNGKTGDIANQVTWTSGTMSVATITASGGLATGVAAGSSTITATMGKVSGTASLTVTAATLVSIAVTPPTPSITVGAMQQFKATGTYSDASTKDLSSQVTWNSATTSVATITASGGLATGVAIGTSNITATLGTVFSPADVLTVTAAGVTLNTITINPATATIPVGGTEDFTATGHFSDGSTMILAAATWTGTTATASITGTSVTSGTTTTSIGLAMGLVASATAVTITATSSSISGTAVLTVSAPVARNGYIAGVSDGNAATYALNSSTASLLPIASVVVNGSPAQIIPEPSGRFAFILRANTIATASIDPATGRLSGIQSVLNTTVNSNFGVVDPTGQYLYVASSGAAISTLNPYLINLVDGSLTNIGSPIPVGTTANSLTSVIVDRVGKYVYAVDSAGGNVLAFSIGAGGALTALSTPSYPTGGSPQYPAIDPSNTHLYIPNQNDGSITAYTINADGSLTTVTGSPFTAGIGLLPTVAAFDTNATPHFFVTNAGDNTVSVLTIGAGGALSAAVAGSPFPAGSTPVGIAIDPANTSVAVVNEFGNSISTYTVASTGVLTPATPLPLVEAPGGAFLINFGIGTSAPSISPGAVFAANSGSGDISAFTSSTSTGVLSPAAGSPVTGLTGNSFAATDLEGNFLFTGSVAGTQIGGFSVTPSSGAVAALTGSPLTVTGTDKASATYVSPSDGFAYALDVSSGSVVQYTLTSTTVTGPGSTVSAFAGAANLAADPQGDFLFALGTSVTNGIQPFTTYLNGGALLAATQSPALPGNWTSGAVDGSGQFLVAVDSTAKTLQSFLISLAGSGTDGVLSVVGGTVAVTGTGPFVVAFDPLDRVVFVADQAAGTVTVYPFDVATGLLGVAGAVTPVSASGLTQISTDITGTYLYAGVKAVPGPLGGVAVYKIGAGGTLTAVAGSPFPTGTGNPGIAVTNVVQ